MCLVVAIDSLRKLNLEADVSWLRLGSLADLQLSLSNDPCKDNAHFGTSLKVMEWIKV